jgi:hypothetical protein
MNDTGYEFMISDLDLALTLTRIAAQSPDDAEKRARNIQNACRAYEKIRELLTRVGLSGEQQKHVNEKLTTLKSALEKVGHHF